jgi:hypothetical protein
VTLVDLEPSSEPGLVLGNGAALPFADASFDAVTAFDTLEHVPPRVREAFVRECRRVARRYVAIVGPYEHRRGREAERILQLFLKAKLGVEHRYLEEHRHHGLPDRARSSVGSRTPERRSRASRTATSNAGSRSCARRCTWTTRRSCAGSRRASSASTTRRCTARTTRRRCTGTW